MLDIGLITGISGTIISIIALVVSILGFLYHRRRTNIMEEQITIIKEEAQKKKIYEELSKKIRLSISKIKECLDLNYFQFHPLWETKNDIVSHIHDKKLGMLKFHIKPLSLTLSYFDGKKNYERFTVNSKEAFIRCIKRNLANSGRVSGEISFDCELDLQNNFFDLGDACDALRTFYMAHSELEAFDYLIAAFDNSILKELKKTIGDLVGVIYGSIIKEHEIVFRSTDTSNEILAKLLDEIFGLESIKKLLQKLNELCDQRLNLIQKEFFLKS